MVEAAPVVDSTTPPVVSTTQPTTSGDWFESLPADLKVEKSLQSFKGKGVGDVAKSYVEAQKMIGGSIRLPRPDATDAEKNAFYADIYKKLGQPDTVEGYEAKTPQLPDGTPWDQASQGEFLSVAHKHGLNKPQAQALIDWYGGTLARGMEKLNTERAAVEKQLRTEWGNDFERKESLASRAAFEIGGEEYAKLLEMKGIAHNPLVLRAHAAFGEALAESKLITGDIPGQPGQSDATSRLQAIFGNKEHPYHKGDPKAVEEVLNLTRIEQGAAGRKVVATMG